jgi:hypothetical protein
MKADRRTNRQKDRHTDKQMKDGQTNRRTYSQMKDGQTKEWTDKRINRQKDGQTGIYGQAGIAFSCQNICFLMHFACSLWSPALLASVNGTFPV